MNKEDLERRIFSISKLRADLSIRSILSCLLHDCGIEDCQHHEEALDKYSEFIYDRFIKN